MYPHPSRKVLAAATSGSRPVLQLTTAARALLHSLLRQCRYQRRAQLHSLLRHCRYQRLQTCAAANSCCTSAAVFAAALSQLRERCCIRCCAIAGAMVTSRKAGLTMSQHCNVEVGSLSIRSRHSQLICAAGCAFSRCPLALLPCCLNALLPCCLIALLPFALLPCCLVALLPCCLLPCLLMPSTHWVAPIEVK